MKIKLKEFKKLFLYALIIFASFITILSVVPANVLASGEKYVFYYDKSNLGSIKQGFKNGQFGTSLNSSFDSTSVYGKGGVFQNTPYAFQLDQAATDIVNSNASKGVATLVYNSVSPLSCTVNKNPPGFPSNGIYGPNSGGQAYKLSIPLTMTVTLPEKDLTSAPPGGAATQIKGLYTIDNSQISLTSSGTIDDANLGNPGSAIPLDQIITGLNNDFNESTNASNYIPSSCLPSGLNPSNGKSGSFPITNYNWLLPSIQKQWPNLQSSSAIANSGFAQNNPTPTPQAGSASGEVVCEDTGYGLGWIFCKVIDGISSGIDDIYNGIIEPLLLIKPINFSNTSPDHIYKIWSNFRIYGDVFLVIALLVIVFGESIGGGLIDAYSVKKILPRLLIAAILINTSIYIVSVGVDLTNIVGNGLGALIMDPFKNNIHGAYVLKLDPVTGAIGSAATVGTLATIIWGSFHAGLVGTAIIYFAIVVLIPALFIMLAILATIVFRRGLIILLVLLSPVAFALYCLPNTEKYFRQWWDLLFKTLLVYPIIAALFALGNVLSITISNSSSNGLTGVTAPIASLLGVVSLFVPLFLIPFSFKIAGGFLGRFHEFASQATARGAKGIIGDEKDPSSLRNRAKDRFNRSRIQSRADTYNSRFGRGVAKVPGIGRFAARRGFRAEQLASVQGSQVVKGEALAQVANDEMALRAGMASSDSQAVALYGKAAADRWRATGLGRTTSTRMAAYQAAVADGTVFKDLNDETQAIVDIAGTNDALRTRLQGTGYAGNKAAGRPELAASWGTRNGLATRMANGEVIQAWEWDAAAVEGMRGTTNTDLMSRTKAVGMRNGSDAMSREIMRLRSIADDPTTTSAHRQSAEATVQEIVAKTENMRGAGLYGSEALASIMQGGSATTSAVDLEHRGTAPVAGEIQNIQQQVQEIGRLRHEAGQARAAGNNVQAERGEQLARNLEQQIEPYLRQVQRGQVDPRQIGGDDEPHV